MYVWNNEKKVISDVFRAENEYEAICSVKFSVDGTQLIVGDEIGRVRLIDIEKGKEIR